MDGGINAWKASGKPIEEGTWKQRSPKTSRSAGTERRLSDRSARAPRAKLTANEPATSHVVNESARHWLSPWAASCRMPDPRRTTDEIDLDSVPTDLLDVVRDIVRPASAPRVSGLR